MNLAKKLLMTTGTSSGTVPTPSGGYVDDVFSAYTYTGNSSTQTINNGIDLAQYGGLVWTKIRSIANNHNLNDTVTGINKYLVTNTTQQQQIEPTLALNSVTSTGYTLNTSSGNMNYVGYNYASWTFRKAPKFFDVVTYTGDGVAARQIAHSLGVQAGFITVKSTSATGDWNSYHHSATGDLKLNLTDAQTASRAIITAADANTFTVSGAANTNGVSYVAYLWAHDPSTDGIIQCGSFTTDSSGNATVNLGWEPQFLMARFSSTADNWRIHDTARGWEDNIGGVDALLYSDLSNAENKAADRGNPTSTGFAFRAAANQTCTYLAIRRPNKPPTSGTQVYNAIARTGTGAAATVTGVGFAPDLVNIACRNYVTNKSWYDRLRGATHYLTSTDDNQEAYQADALTGFDVMDGVKLGADNNGYVNSAIGGRTYINHFFRRAPGFLDGVCDTGTGAAHAIAHNLTKAPELIIRKSRSAVKQWEVWHSALLANEHLVLNSTAAKSTDATAWNSTLPTSTAFTVGASANTNASGVSFVTYLFTTLPGVSKVGSYSGNGGTQTIPCGFTTGSRFILIKRIDNTGDWFVWDTTRGITPTTDPHLSLNTVLVEVTTDDSIDQDASGFVVNQNAATNINALGGNYLFLAIA